MISLNFHPFYSNEKEICQKEEFHTNYVTIKFQENILTTRTDSLNKVSCGSEGRSGKEEWEGRKVVVMKGKER